jgi:hypothetical protein
VSIVKAPIKIDGSIEIEEASGRCAVVGCKVRGGGLLKVNILDEIASGIWKEHPVTICGGCMATVLTNALQST